VYSRTRTPGKRNLLVVDWDTFFYDPSHGPLVVRPGESKTDARTYLQLFDWGHKEAPFFQEAVWPTP
jgi:hypothetical protein